jgi:hypothetical protein
MWTFKLTLSKAPTPPYGQGKEAMRAAAVRNRPEMSCFHGSDSPNHWAYLQIADLVGQSNMQLLKLRGLATWLPKAFPNEAKKCERDLLRIWAGCISYLVGYASLLKRTADEEGREAFQKRVLDFGDSPEEEEKVEKVETSTPRVPFPSFFELVKAAGYSCPLGRPGAMSPIGPGQGHRQD